jgi:hypothetical protein
MLLFFLSNLNSRSLDPRDYKRCVLQEAETDGVSFSVSLVPSLASERLVMSVVFTVTVDLISCCASCNNNSALKVTVSRELILLFPGFSEPAYGLNGLFRVCSG